MTATRMRTTTWMGPLAALLALAAGCGTGSGDPRDPGQPGGGPVVVSVEVVPDAVTLEVGETLALAALVTTEETEPARAEAFEVTFESLDGTVVSVSGDGTIEGLRPGTTRVVASAGGVHGEALVTVKVPGEEPPPAVDHVSLSPAAFGLQVGATALLEALALDGSGEPVEAAITFTSLNEDVATVSEGGLVTAIAQGTTEVVAEAGGKSARATVTVSAAPPPPPGTVAAVVLSETAVTLAEGTRHRLSATPVDVNGQPVTGLAVMWRTADEGIAYVDAGGEVRATRTGEVDVTATVHGKTATARVTVTLDTPYDLFFAAFVDEEQRHAFWRLDPRVPGAEAERVLDGPAGPSWPVPSPDGTRLAAAVSVPGTTVGRVRVLTPGGETLAWITFPGHVEEPAWSPDGERLALTVRDATGVDVWTVNADGSDPVNLTAAHGASNELSPSWSPVALGRIAYTRMKDGVYSVWTMAVDGSDARQLTTGPADVDPAWSPDGEVIAFQRSGMAVFGDLYFVRPDGSGLRSLGQLPGIQAFPAWSPDGALLLFASGDDLYTVRRDGGGLARRTFDGDVRQEVTPGWILR